MTIHQKQAGSFGSAVDDRTRINLYGVKSWLHIFSGSFGSAVDDRTRNDWYGNKSPGISLGFIYLAARLALLARQWMIERGIIGMALRLGFTYSAARLALLARKWMKERGLICMALIKSWLHIFSGSFGSFGSAVDDRGANEPNEPARLICGC